MLCFHQASSLRVSLSTKFSAKVISFCFSSSVNFKVISLDFMIKPKYIKPCVGSNNNFTRCMVKPNNHSIITVSFTFFKQLS